MLCRFAALGDMAAKQDRKAVMYLSSEHPWNELCRALGKLLSRNGYDVLSAGDGVGEDPLFALGDLASLGDRLGGMEGKTVALCGATDACRGTTGRSFPIAGRL